MQNRWSERTRSRSDISITVVVELVVADLDRRRRLAPVRRVGARAVERRVCFGDTPATSEWHPWHLDERRARPSRQRKRGVPIVPESKGESTHEHRTRGATLGIYLVWGMRGANGFS